MFMQNIVFQTYGISNINDLPANDLIPAVHEFCFYTGANTFAIGIVYFLNRDGANVKAVLLAGAIIFIFSAYVTFSKHIDTMTVPAWMDMGVKVCFALGFVYYYFQEK